MKTLVLRRDHVGHALASRCSHWMTAGMALVLCLAIPLAPAHAQDERSDVLEMGLEELGSLDIEITSVAKKEQKISESAAAVAVITGEDIRRAGHTTVPEALRMIPGMDVRRLNSNSWSVTARGFGNDFSNKLLVMVDGRSVYTPLFAGVYWDENDLMIEDIDRIEVIRGPGGTIWGANAVNGVVNIITKRADKTHGTQLSLLAGPPETDSRAENVIGTARYGGQTRDLHYRVYGKYMDRPSFNTPGGGKGNEDWWQTRGGFRMDLLPEEGDTTATATGEFYYGKVQSAGISLDGALNPKSIDNDVETIGGHVLGRVSHELGGGQNVTVQTYYDIESRDDILGERRHTFDFDAQHSFPMLDGMLNTIWGLSYRYTRSEMFSESALAMMNPPTSTDNLFAGFVQFELEPIEDLLRITLGTKVENNDYTGWEFQPTGRVAVFPVDDVTVWASVSRAIRTPAQIEDDIRIVLADDIFMAGPDTFIPVALGNTNVDSEELLAIEAGSRWSPTSSIDLDVAFYANKYDNLITNTGRPPTPIAPNVFEVPVVFTNEGNGWTWGAELLVNWKAASWLRYTATYSYIDMDITDGLNAATRALPDTEDARVPNHMFHLRQLVNLPYKIEWDTMLYFWDQLDDGSGPRIDQTLRLDIRLGYRPVEWLDLSVVGANLTDHPRQEAQGLLGAAGEVPRSFYLKGTIEW